jgi:hypothetical protein
MRNYMPRPNFVRVAAVAALASISALHAQDNSDCNLIITTGLRNYNISSSSSSALDTIYSNYCDASGNANSSSTNVGVNAVISEIPVGLTFGANDATTAFHNFCKNYQSTYQSSQSRANYESTIVTKAYDAFNQCAALHANGISIKHNVINLASSSFFFGSSAEHPLTIEGVTTSANVGCSGQDPTGKLIQYSASTNVKSTKTISFVCKRTPKPVTGNDYYDEGTISIATNVGNYDVFLPHDTKFALDQASQINQQIQEVQTGTAGKIAAVNARISGIALTETQMSTLPEFGCGGQSIATQPFTYAIGSRDGTSCGVTNRVYVKTLGLSIPPAQ